MQKKERLDINRIAFIGRTYAEYMSMFDLVESELRNSSVLDCPAGPSSFAAEANRKGFHVTACDIHYDQQADNLLQTGKGDIDHVFEKFDEVSHLYTWEYYDNKDEIMALRNKSLELFINDFPYGCEKGRYRYAELPNLPFADNTFSLVLSGNFLFLYGDRLSPDFHKSCLKELIRVCSGEIRIFPLCGLDAKPYDYSDDIISYLKSYRIAVEITQVPFEFQRGSNRMMKLSIKDKKKNTGPGNFDFKSKKLYNRRII